MKKLLAMVLALILAFGSFYASLAESDENQPACEAPIKWLKDPIYTKQS